MNQEKYEGSTKGLVKAAVSGWLGTALELVDFQSYSLGAALVFHEIFFPEQPAVMALILAMDAHGVGYIAHIVGVFISGKMGGNIGRRKVLFITTTMMGICTALTDVLPTYAQIGIFTPVLLVTLRIAQGLGVGTETSGAGMVLVEYAPKGKRGITSSLVTMGASCGTLSATAIWAVMSFALDREELLAWGWRIPFLASVAVMIFTTWLCMNLKKSPVFGKMNDEENVLASDNSPENMLGVTFISKSLWLATGLRFEQVGNSELIQTFLADYLARALLLDKLVPIGVLIISSVLSFITIPLLGWLPDKFGYRLPYIIPNISAIILTYPMLSTTVDKTYSPGVIMTALIVIHNPAVSRLFALKNITMAEMFDTCNRSMWMAISKEAGGLVAVGFGPVPAGIFYNMTNSWWPVPAVVIAYSLIGLIPTLLMPEVRDRDLSVFEDAIKVEKTEKARYSVAQTS